MTTTDPDRPTDVAAANRDVRHSRLPQERRPAMLTKHLLIHDATSCRRCTIPRTTAKTAALDAGVPLRDVQEAASHADPRTTMRYDRARVSLDRHATYIVSTFIAGASR